MGTNIDHFGMPVTNTWWNLNQKVRRRKRGFQVKFYQQVKNEASKSSFNKESEMRL